MAKFYVRRHVAQLRGGRSVSGAMGRSDMGLWLAFCMTLASGVGLTAVMASNLRSGGNLRIDAALLRAFRDPQNLADPIGPRWVHQSAIEISALGSTSVLALATGLAIIYLAKFGRRAEAAALATASLGTWLMNRALKDLFDRPRPTLVPHLADVTSSSFPSHHAMSSAAVYLTLGLLLAGTVEGRFYRTIILLIAVVLIGLIGLSRVYLGVHWPSDVACGWLIGATLALAIQAVQRMWTSRTAAQHNLKWITASEMPR